MKENNFSFKKYLFDNLPSVLKSIIGYIWNEIHIYPSKKWASKKSIDIIDYMRELSPNLLNESLNFSSEIEDDYSKKRKLLKFTQGGGGCYHFLYFLTKLYKPELILETGVASGWSSTAFLKAIYENKCGKLFSSDLPYPNQEGSINNIGILVPQYLKNNWLLCTEGDEICLPKFIGGTKFNIVHYDSAKSYTSRVKFWDTVKDHLSENALIIFDDIQDNFHFHDLVDQIKVDYKIFNFKGKYIGYFKYK